MNGQFQPICQRIANRILLDVIKYDALQPGERLPTIALLVKRYGVSITTISSALAQLEQDGWIRVQAGSGSYVERAFLQHTKNREHRLGLILPRADKELALRTYQGVESVANQYGWQLTLTESHESYDQERAEVQRLIKMGCDAIVLISQPRTIQQEADDYLKREFTDFSIVLVGCAIPAQKRPQVVFDNYALGYDMASMLVKNGRTRIAFMISDDISKKYNHPILISRFAGVRDAMHYAGLPDSHLSVGHINYAFGDGENSVESYFKSWKLNALRPNALITLNDQPAMYVISTALTMGISVPEELIVVGHDNLMAARNFSPSFCSSNPNFVLMGAEAARHAIERATGISDQPAVIVIPVGIVTRGSTLNVG